MLCSVNVQVLIDVVNVHSTLCRLVEVVSFTNELCYLTFCLRIEKWVNGSCFPVLLCRVFLASSMIIFRFR